MSKYNLTTIAEGMGYKEFEDAKEEERLDKHPDKEMIKKVKAMMAKEKSVKEGDAVDLAIEASQEKAGIKTENVIKEEEGFVEVSQDEIKMHLDQYRDGNIDGDDLANAVEEIVFSRMDESFDSLAKKLDKQKGIDKEEAGKIAGSIAAKKMKGAGKGPTAKQKKRMNEGEVPMELLKAIQKYSNEDNGMGFQDALKNIKTALYKVNRETRGRMSEADAIPTSAGEMKRGDDGKMYNVIASNAERKRAMRSVMDILRDELSVSQDDAFDYIKTHRDDLFDGTVDAFDRDDVVDDYKNYESVNEASDKSLQEKQYAPEVVDRIEMVRKVLGGTNNFNAKEIEAYTRSLIGDFEKGDFEAYDDYKANDYVEDIKNFISDKALQEHFGRFMKDYQ